MSPEIVGRKPYDTKVRKLYKPYDTKVRKLYKPYDTKVRKLCKAYDTKVRKLYKRVYCISCNNIRTYIILIGHTGKHSNY